MKTATTNKNTVSVIIPAYNEELTIKRCLDSLASSDYKNIEIIVADDCSSDKTSLVAERLAQKFKLNLKVIRNKSHKERSRTRNLGAKISIGNYLLFIDSDMRLDKKVISECMRLINTSRIIKAVIIPEKSYGEGFWAECRSLEKQCYIGDDRVEAARFFEKETFWDVGGWDNKMISGEDWDLTRRVRTSFVVGRIHSFIYHNEYHLTLWKTIKKKFYYASVSGIYLEKNPLTLLNVIFFIFKPSFVRNWKLILSDPLHAVGMFSLKVIELFAGGAGYLVSKLPNLY